MPDRTSAAPRPYVLASCAMSLDGHLDDRTAARLVLSGPADLDQVDALRAGCDAILVGAGTVRRDDPRLAVRSAARRADRRRRGLPVTPVPVLLTRGGGLDPGARVFGGDGPAPLVYCPAAGLAATAARLGAAATVLDAGAGLAAVLADLAARGIGRLLVEGGTEVLTGVLAAGLADELRLAVAPLFVGDPAAPRFVGAGAFPWTAARRARLLGVDAAGDVAVLRYSLSDRAPTDRAPTDRAPTDRAPTDQDPAG